MTPPYNLPVSHEFLPGKDQATEGESSEVGCALPNVTRKAAVKYVHSHVGMNLTTSFLQAHLRP